MWGDHKRLQLFFVPGLLPSHSPAQEEAQEAQEEEDDSAWPEEQNQQDEAKEAALEDFLPTAGGGKAGDHQGGWRGGKAGGRPPDHHRPRHHQHHGSGSSGRKFTEVLFLKFTSGLKAQIDYSNTDTIKIDFKRKEPTAETTPQAEEGKDDNGKKEPSNEAKKGD